MSANCPFLYDTNGVRHPSEQVFIRALSKDGSPKLLAVRSDVKSGERTPYVTRDGVSVDGAVSLEELPTTQAAFVISEGVEIPVVIAKDRSQGRRGRNSFDSTVFARLRAEHGEQTARAYATRAIRALPGILEDEEVLESRRWARDVLTAASREMDGGLLGVLREHQGAVQLFAKQKNHTAASELREQVVTRVSRHRNVARFVTETLGGSFEDSLVGSSDPLLRSAYRTLSRDEAEMLRGVLCLEPVEVRSALLSLGADAPVEVLEALLDSDHTTLVKVAAFYSLVGASPESASRRALGILGAAKLENPMSNDTARLCEAAVGALDETMRRKIALDTNAPWLWQKVAVSSLTAGHGDDVVDAVCESRVSHPLARIAAVGRCGNEAVLARVAESNDRRLAAAATARLDSLRGKGSEIGQAELLDARLPPATQIRLVAIDIDGTFAADDGTVPSLNTEAARTFADRGGVVAFTTTRSAEYALPLAREALSGRDAYLVCDDGASIIDVQSGVFLRGVTPAWEHTSPGVVRDGHVWLLPAQGGTSLEEAASAARALSGVRGGVVVEKAAGGGWALRYGVDKGATIEDVAALAGVALGECCVFGDGKVDLPMFEKVRTAGGVVVAVGNAQPSVATHPAISIRTLSNNDGGVGHVINALSEGSWPQMESRAAQQFSFSEEVYAQYAVLDPSSLAESLRTEGLEHLVEYRPGSTFHGGTWCQPGHVTFAHPNDFKGSVMPDIADATLQVVGYVDTESVTALVCSVDDGTGATTTRPDGKTYHITIRTQTGVPPVHSNQAVAGGWTALSTPIPFSSKAVRQRRSKR
jgi:hydroxymethylpyrimidine pyrophosphatase-like HAD family hydrolase